VKANGDGFMVVFTSAARALRCAAAVQQAVRRVHPGGEEVRLHIGLHAGEVVHDGTDLIGQAVNLASRLTDAAGPDEILVSTLARELAAGSREFRFGEPREVDLKGLGPRVAFPLEWKATETL
jgi:class 3 adenylate cyclase